MKIKNRIIQWLLKCGQFMPRFEGERFLVVSTTGLGDTLWGTPAIRALRQAYPKAYIGILTSDLGAEVLGGNPHIDELFVVGKHVIFSLIQLFKAVRNRKIGTVFIFHTSQRTVLPFCHLIGASRIVGTEGINKGLDFILTEKLKNRPLHEIQRRLHLVGVQANGFKMELSVSEEERQNANLLLQAIPVFLPIIGLHPGSKDKFKQWPAEYFIEVGNRLKNHLPCQIVVTGGMEEKELVEKVAQGIEAAIPMTGQLSVHALGALIEKMSLMITNDTGPMHIGVAMKTPVIGLFGPTDYRLCGPYFVSHATVIQKEKTCTPCLKKKCNEPFCLLQISKDEVFETARRLLDGS